MKGCQGICQSRDLQGYMFAVYAQEHQRVWLNDAMNKLNGEAVEKEVAASIRTMHKTGKAFAQRGMQTYAGNCETIKAEIEQFQKTVPLLVVSSSFWMSC